MAIEISGDGSAKVPARRDDLAFVERLTGWTITGEDHPAGSPIGRMFAMIAARDAGQITDEECVAAIRRIHRAALEAAIEDPA
jgi:hypothetical protein